MERAGVVYMCECIYAYVLEDVECCGYVSYMCLICLKCARMYVRNYVL